MKLKRRHFLHQNIAGVQQNRLWSYITFFLFIRICFIRVSRLKFNFVCLKFVINNTTLCFLLNRIKFFLSLKDKTSQTATKTAVNVCFALLTFPKVIMCIIYRALLSAVWLQNYVNTMETSNTLQRKTSYTMLYKIIHSNISA